MRRLLCCHDRKEVRALQTTHAIAVRDCQVRSTQAERKRRTAEAVVLLCRKDIDNHIEVKLELDEEDVVNRCRSFLENIFLKGLLYFCSILYKYSLIIYNKSVNVKDMME